MYFAVVSTPPPPSHASAITDYGGTSPRIVRVHNDNGAGRSTAVPISQDSTGEDLLDCVRDPGYIMVHLVARWRHKEILVLPTDNIVTLLRELEEEGEGSGEEEEVDEKEEEGGERSGREVQFVVKYEHIDSLEGFRLGEDGREWNQERPDTTNEELCEFQWLFNLPETAGTAHMTLADLQALAARQQVAMETQQQALAARQTRLRYLQQQEQRQQQLCSEEARLTLMRERVQEQELKLKKLRALKGQVEQCRSHNGGLNSELEAVRALFNQKEKELAMAVTRVDALMKQLQDLREVKAKEVIAHGNRGKGEANTALTLEVERLRKELLQRNQINTQYSTRLAAQQQLLQQRKDQVTKVDARIEELQQRLKKRRSQPPVPPPQPPVPPPQPSQQPETGSTERGGGEGGGWGTRTPFQGRKVGQNVAAVEPYIQHPPKNARKEDGPCKGKEEAGSKAEETLPRKSSSGGKGSPKEGSPTQLSSPRPAEVNNNNNTNNNNKDRKSGGRGAGEAAEEYKIPSIISSHFDIQRVRGGSVGKGAVSGGGKNRGEGGGVGVAATTASVGSGRGTPPHSSSPPTQKSSALVKNSAVNSVAPASQPVLNSFGKPGSLPKWPPPPVVSDDVASDPSSPHPHPPQPSLPQPAHHPHINIFDEERQAGSGQSSPASSEGSGPLVKQGSGVFSHQSPVGAAATTTTGQPASNSGGATATGAQTLQQGGRKTGGAQSASALEPRAQQSSSGRQAPKPPPRMPQTVLHSKGPVSPLSPSSMLVSSAAAAASSSSSVCSPPSSSSSVPSFTSPVDSAEQGKARMSPRKQDPSQNSSEASTGGSSTEQGEGGKVASSGIHLNQRPAPTYRYASRNVITNTYTSRLGSSALQHYQQLNQHLYSSSSPSPSSSSPLNTHSGDNTTQPTAPESSTDSTDSAPAPEGEEYPPGSETQSLPPDRSMVVMVGSGEDGLTHFGLVGSPSYPDIASDKGSYKSNTPKQVRRRHSDSDNEELAKVLKRGGDRTKLEQVTEDGASGNNAITAQPDTPKSSVSSEGEGSDSAPPSPSRLQEGGVATVTSMQKVAGVSLRQKKTILKGDRHRRRSSSNRVSFDPLALLLDASLEGELDLVMRTAKEVDDVSRPNDEGITALHNAICAGHYNIVKFLIEFGADVNSPDSDGWTPLHCAASCNNLPMVRFLVEHGACLFATTHSDHETAADKCEEDEDGYDHCSDYLYGVQEKLGIANNGAVYAVFDYSASKQDELSLNINDKLTVLRKGDEEEKEWWWAVGLSNREGYIPRNLLGLCPRVLPSSYQPLQTSDC